MASWPDTFQPFWENEGVGTEIERQRWQFHRVDTLQIAPDRLVRFSITDYLRIVERLVHRLIGESGIVLPGPAVVWAGDHLGM